MNHTESQLLLYHLEDACRRLDRAREVLHLYGKDEAMMDDVVQLQVELVRLKTAAARARARI